MHFTHLGRSGLTVSRLCLGTMNFGPEASASDSHAILDHALEIGINFIDTANVYGWKMGEGITERILGDWITLGGRRRERIVLATKFHNPMGDGPNEKGCSAYHIRAACDASLRRLKTDHIDLYQMHHIDRTTPWEEVWQALDHLIMQGKILYVGSSNFAGWNIASICESARQRHILGIVSEQSKYSLACRSVELEVIPACRHYGVGVIPWSPLDGGLLGGVLGGDAGQRRSSDAMRSRITALQPQLQRWEDWCRERHALPGDIALAWLLANPVVTAPIIGPRTKAQLDRAVAALDVTLSSEDLAALDRIWPGPGNQAPEAYAW